MTKSLNQIIFFFLHRNLNIFFSNIGNQNIFLEKNHNPPFKLNGRSLNTIYGRIKIGLSLSSVSKHNMWSYYDWVVVVFRQ